MAKVMISLPDDFLTRVDRLARQQHRSRSEVIREALRLWMSDPAGRSAPSWREALRPLRDLEREWVGQWDAADVIRHLRDTRHGDQNRR
ncbi:hypothetical protein BH18GEM1_BH18GEM1_21870 [soil metagenome]